LLDERIFAGYRLTPNNYIAHDLRYGKSLYHDRYTAEQKEAFLNHMETLNKYDECNQDVLKDIFLGIYANPVNNKK
jgi:hypothetical protein